MIPDAIAYWGFGFDTVHHCSVFAGCDDGICRHLSTPIHSTKGEDGTMRWSSESWRLGASKRFYLASFANVKTWRIFIPYLFLLSVRVCSLGPETGILIWVMAGLERFYVQRVGSTAANGESRLR